MCTEFSSASKFSTNSSVVNQLPYKVFPAVAVTKPFHSHPQLSKYSTTYSCLCFTLLNHVTVVYTRGCLIR